MGKKKLMGKILPEPRPLKKWTGTVAVYGVGFGSMSCLWG